MNHWLFWSNQFKKRTKSDFIYLKIFHCWASTKLYSYEYQNCYENHFTWCRCDTISIPSCAGVKNHTVDSSYFQYWNSDTVFGFKFYKKEILVKFKITQKREHQWNGVFCVRKFNRPKIKKCLRFEITCCHVSAFTEFSPLWSSQ